MRTLYIECKMGAAGDMLMASLYELLEDKQGISGYDERTRASRRTGWKRRQVLPAGSRERI